MVGTMNYEVDWGGLAGVIGTITGASRVVDDDKYMDMVLTEAHKRAADQFDRDAVAYAESTGQIRHMFEWGTPGINEGSSNMHFSPNSPQAKLWTHRLTGGGKEKSASFVFRPSIANVPPPTPEKTGVTQTELNKLTGGPYVFRMKAAVFESGRAVVIRPRNVSKLFVAPANGRHGFVFTKGPVRAIPGASLAGNFSTFWMGWWSSQGDQIVTDYVEDETTKKMATLVDSIGRRIGRRPIRKSTVAFRMDVEQARKFAERQMYGRRR